MNISHYSLFLLSLIYLLLPAYIANIAPVIAARLPGLKKWGRPIDNGLQFGGQQLFGQSKTWRGFISGVVVATLIALLQRGAQNIGWLEGLRLLDYSHLPIIAYGVLAGLGTMLGDLIKSFFKRRIGITSGAPWPVFDQLDFVLGYFIATSPLIHWTELIIWSALIITLVLHPLFNILGFLLNLKKVWW